MRILPLALALIPALAVLQDSEGSRAPALPTVGEPAPAFRLNDHTGKLASIGGAADRWTVVAFYPKAMTPG